MEITLRGETEFMIGLLLVDKIVAFSFPLCPMRFYLWHYVLTLCEGESKYTNMANEVILIVASVTAIN